MYFSFSRDFSLISFFIISCTTHDSTKSENSSELTTITTELGEGIIVIKGPEYYYMFASRGICCKGNDSTYQIVVGRSKSLEGPYLNKEDESWVDNNYSLLFWIKFVL